MSKIHIKYMTDEALATVKANTCLLYTSPSPRDTR